MFVDHPTFTDLLIEADLLPERFVDPFEAAEPVVTERRCQSGHGDPIDPQTAMQIALEGYVPENGNPKCRRHNLLGNHGYTTSRDRHGQWHTHRPDGTAIP